MPAMFDRLRFHAFGGKCAGLIKQLRTQVTEKVAAFGEEYEQQRTPPLQVIDPLPAVIVHASAIKRLLVA